MTAQLLPTWAGWIALTTWGLGWGLAGGMLGRWLERRHQDDRITTAVRLADATRNPYTATSADLAELDRLSQTLKRIDAENSGRATTGGYPSGDTKVSDLKPPPPNMQHRSESVKHFYRPWCRCPDCRKVPTRRPRP